MLTALTLLVFILLTLGLFTWLVPYQDPLPENPLLSYLDQTHYLATVSYVNAQGEDWVQDEPCEYYYWEAAQLLAMQANELAYQEKVYACAEKCAQDEQRFEALFGEQSLRYLAG